MTSRMTVRCMRKEFKESLSSIVGIDTAKSFLDLSQTFNNSVVDDKYVNATVLRSHVYGYDGSIMLCVYDRKYDNKFIYCIEPIGTYSRRSV